MSLIEQARNISTNWREVILKILDKNPTINESFQKECDTFEQFLPIYPKTENIFRCFNYFNIEDTKVVILGQDPYHGPEQAIGLCFGVDKGKKIPPSLRNIMKKLPDNELDTTLEHWAKQGVLLLNASLSVRHKTPASHMKIWKKFTTNIIEHINKCQHSVIFVAWGAFAHRTYDGIVDPEKHYMIISSHPSPLSYSRPYRGFSAFKNYNPFLLINAKLPNEKGIRW